MKKLIFLALAINMYGLSASAQRQLKRSNAETTKTIEVESEEVTSEAKSVNYSVSERGSNSLEIGFNPFSNNYSTFRINDLKYRHFWGHDALRIRAKLQVDKEKSGSSNVYDLDVDGKTGNSLSWSKKSNAVFGIAVGYERYFELNSRLSLYTGVEFGYEGCFVSNRSYSESDITYYNYDKKEISGYYDSKSDYKTKNASGAYNALTTAIFTGIDFNIYKGLYLGAEIGLYYKYSTTPESYRIGEDSNRTYSKTHVLESSNMTSVTYSDHITTTVSSNTSNNKTSTQTQKSRTSEKIDNHHQFNLDVIPALRIGWRF